MIKWSKRSTLLAVIFAALFLSAVAPSFSNALTHSATASASTDPIAVGNWQYDQYDSIIVAEAQNHGLDPFVIKGQIMLESAFNPNALSPWGDQGLMQLKLSTAEALGYTGTWSGLFDPWTSIHYGCIDMQQLMWTFGDISLALQAYNIGTYAVESGQRNWQYSDIVLNYAQQFRNEHAALYGPSSTTSYTVQSGDTLYSISTRYGVSWQSIAQANGIGSPYVIYVGEQLTIPTGGSTTGSSTPTTYTVQSGDTLYSIGQKFGVSWQTIAQANGISSPYTINVGEKLTIP